jgi:hypothetical protein
MPSTSNNSTWEALIVVPPFSRGLGSQYPLNLEIAGNAAELTAVLVDSVPAQEDTAPRDPERLFEDAVKFATLRAGASLAGRWPRFTIDRSGRWPQIIVELDGTRVRGRLVFPEQVPDLDLGSWWQQVPAELNGALADVAEALRTSESRWSALSISLSLSYEPNPAYEQERSQLADSFKDLAVPVRGILTLGWLKATRRQRRTMLEGLHLLSEGMWFDRTGQRPFESRSDPGPRYLNFPINIFHLRVPA